MRDRFTTLFHLSENLYCADCPIIISAGALLLDNNTGSVLAQFKFKSVSENRIKALKLQLSAFDISGLPVSSPIDYQYLDLNIGYGESFGTNKAIIMPTATVRTFSVHHLTIVFVDGQIQEIHGPWIVLSPPQELDFSLKTPELIKQYQLETTPKAKFIPKHISDLWMCTCGEINKIPLCAKCKTPENIIFSAYDVPTLTEHMNIRLAEERHIFEREAIEKKEKRRHNLIALISVCLLLCIITIAATTISSKNAAAEKLKQISEIEQLINEEKFEHAFDAVLKSNLTKEEKESFCQLLIPDMTSQFYLKQGKLSSNGLEVDGISLHQESNTVRMTDQNGNLTTIYEFDPGKWSVAFIDMRDGETRTWLLGDMIYANGSVFFIEYTDERIGYSRKVTDEICETTYKIRSVDLESGYVSTIRANDFHPGYLGKLNNGKIILSADLFDKYTIFNPYTGELEIDVQLNDNEHIIYRTYDWFLDG